MLDPVTWVDAEENQQWRGQKTATDAEHAGQDPHQSAEQDDDEGIDREIGDWQVYVHITNGLIPFCCGIKGVAACRARKH
jgi:hypothetical protein